MGHHPKTRSFATSAGAAGKPPARRVRPGVIIGASPDGGGPEKRCPDGATVGVGTLGSSNEALSSLALPALVFANDARSRISAAPILRKLVVNSPARFGAAASAGEKQR